MNRTLKTLLAATMITSGASFAAMAQTDMPQDSTTHGEITTTLPPAGNYGLSADTEVRTSAGETITIPAGTNVRYGPAGSGDTLSEGDVTADGEIDVLETEAELTADAEFTDESGEVVTLGSGERIWFEGDGSGMTTGTVGGEAGAQDGATDIEGDVDGQGDIDVNPLQTQ